MAIALVALAVSPLPPLLPNRGEKAGGRADYGLSLVFILAVLGVPMIAISAVIMEGLFGRDYVVAPWSIGRLLILSILMPLVAGMAVARISPSTARRLSGPIEKAQRWLLPIAMIALLISAAPHMVSLIGNHTLTAVGIFVVGTFAVGHLLGDRTAATRRCWPSPPVVGIRRQRWRWHRPTSPTPTSMRRSHSTDW